MSVNKVILVGNVGNDPEIKYIKEDVPVARFSLATNETYKTRDGERRTDTEWHNITVWRGLAKIIEQYVKKGTQIYVEGKLRYSQYEKDGETKYYTDIVAREIRLLGKAPENKGNSNDNFQGQSNNSGNSNNNNSNTSSVQDTTSEFDSFDDVDDLPF